MKNKKLFTQIFPTYLIMITLVIIFFAAYQQRTLKEFYADKIETDLSARAQLIRDHIESIDLNQHSKLDSAVTRLSKSGNVRITLIRADGTVFADSDKDSDSMDNHADRPEIKLAFQDSVGHSIRYSYTLEQQLVYLAVPLKKQQKIIAAVRVAFPLADYEAAIKDLRNQVIFGGIFALLLGTLFSYFISRRISKPLEDIKKGAERFATGTFKPPLAETGSSEINALAVSMNKMARELSERIETISLQRSEQSSMLRSMKEGVLAVDNDERIIRINQAAIGFFAINDDEPRKRLIQEVIRHSSILEFIREALKQNVHLNRDITVTNSGEQILRLTSNPLLDVSGKILGILILINEITRLKKLDKMRQDFVANVSHELKTPITSIKGYMETLREGQVDDTETVEKFYAIVARQADRMNAIVTDLLQLSHIEQQEGYAELLKNNTSLAEIIKTAVEDCQALADEKNIKIRVSVNEQIRVYANNALLEQALINLINNALKYSEACSEVQILAGLEENEIRIHIQDQGCGIDPKYHGRLFERFYRVDKARSRDMGGTGLGLAIVKHIAMVHQGNITVQSRVAQGSTFTLHLPA